MTQPLYRRLSDALNTLPIELWKSGVNGDCDAFALALLDHLSAIGETANLVVISRTRQDNQTGAVVDDNPLSHVVVEALGSHWDVNGPEADERWEADWIQPTDEDAEDSFDFNSVTREALVALRQERDQRPPHPGLMNTYSQWLGTVFKTYALTAKEVVPETAKRARRSP